MRSGLTLDPGTLLFSISMFGFLMAGISLSSAQVMPDHRPALVEWSKAMAAAAGGGFLVFFLKGQVPWAFTFVVANILVMQTAAYGYFAFSRLIDLKPRRTVVWGVVLFAFTGVVAYGLGTSWRVPVFTLSVGVSVVLGMTAMVLGGSVQRRSTPTTFVAAAFFGLMSAAFALRALISVFGEANALSPEAGSTAQVTALLMGGVFIVASSVGFFALAHERQRQATLESSRRDGLTGLYTRTAFFEFAREVEQANPPQPYAIVMVDIDHFKKINDGYGHGGGDVTLSHAARLIAGAVRISDLVGRYGGEEFCVLLRGCEGEQQAAVLAQRLVQEASRQTVRLTDGRTVAYTLSAGYAVAQLPPSGGACGETLGQVIERADQALYRAKREGRNQALPALPLGKPA